MNNRERNWYEGECGRHPPMCTCADCTRKRLGAVAQDEGYYSGRIVCPVCNRLSVRYDGRKCLYVCSNPLCAASGETLRGMGA